MADIKISIIIPTYNSAPFIEETLRSVCEQTYPNFEVIISDDGSNDNTIALAEHFFKQYPAVSYQISVSETNQGAGAARNQGVKLANHDWIAFLDSDDYWVRDKLEKVIQAIDSHDTNYVFHNETYLEKNREYEVDYIARYNATVHPFLALVRINFLSPTCATFHKDLFNAAGGFDVSLRSAQDYDLWLKMSLLGLKLCPLPESLAYYRVRDGNITSNVQARLACLLRIIEKHKQDIQHLSPNPKKELKKWQSRVYSSCGLMFFRQKKYVLGLFYIFYGQLYSLRVDWLKSILAKVKRVMR